MKTETQRIADQLRRSMQGEAWHGPALLEILQDVPVEKAMAKPSKEVHRICEIVLHIRAWHQIVTRRLNGEQVEPTQEQDWPPVPELTPERWRKIVADLDASNAELCEKIEHLAVERLEEIVPLRPHTVYFMLHGLIQHNIYHAGQIVVVKKLS